jgi:hypothetical protein
VRRAGSYSSDDIHRALFAEKLTKATGGDVKEGIRKYIRKRHARS